MKPPEPPFAPTRCAAKVKVRSGDGSYLKTCGKSTRYLVNNEYRSAYFVDPVQGIVCAEHCPPRYLGWFADEFPWVAGLEPVEPEKDKRAEQISRERFQDALSGRWSDRSRKGGLVPQGQP